MNGVVIADDTDIVPIGFQPGGEKLVEVGKPISGNNEEATVPEGQQPANDKFSIN